MKPITFENLRRLMGGGRKKKDKESSFKRSDSFKRISIRKSYLDRGKKKHLQKLEVATQTCNISEDVFGASSSSSGKVDSCVQVDVGGIKNAASSTLTSISEQKVLTEKTVAKDTTTKGAGSKGRSIIAYGQWLKGIKVEECPPVSAKQPTGFKGAERTVIYIPASDDNEVDIKMSAPVIRQLSSSPVFRRKSPLWRRKANHTSPQLQRKESNDSAVEMFPWGDDVQNKSPLFKRSPSNLLPDTSGNDELCSLSVSLGRIWMDAPMAMAPRSLELPRPTLPPTPVHHSLDSALKDRRDDPIVINRLQKKPTPPVARTLSATSSATTSTGLFSSKDSGFSFSISIPKLTDFTPAQGHVPVASKGGFFRKKGPKPKLSVSRDGYFKRTSGALTEIKRNSVRRRSSRKKKALRGSGRRNKKKQNSGKYDMYQVVVSRPPRCLKSLKLDPMIFVPPEKRKSSVRRKQSFKVTLREIRNFNPLDESMYQSMDSTDEGLYECISDDQALSGRMSRISIRGDDPNPYYSLPSTVGCVSPLAGSEGDEDGDDDADSNGTSSIGYAPPGVSPVPRRRPVRRKRSALSHKRSITYVAKPNILRAPSTLKRPAAKKTG